MTDRANAWTAAMALILFGGVAQAAPPPVKAPAPAKPVDVNRFYNGAWIEVARHPTKITAGCIDGGISYAVVTPTKIKVSDYCHADKPAGKLRSIGGPGTIEDPGFNAKMHVSYQYMGIIPIGRELWVLDHDDAYTWFISADPAFENLWIYTRDAHIDPALLKEIVGKASAMGYDVATLEFPAQP